MIDSYFGHDASNAIAGETQQAVCNDGIHVWLSGDFPSSGDLSNVSRYGLITDFETLVLGDHTSPEWPGVQYDNLTSGGTGTAYLYSVDGDNTAYYYVSENDSSFTGIRAITPTGVIYDLFPNEGPWGDMMWDADKELFYILSSGTSDQGYSGSLVFGALYTWEPNFGGGQTVNMYSDGAFYADITAGTITLLDTTERKLVMFAIVDDDPGIDVYEIPPTPGDPTFVTILDTNGGIPNFSFGREQYIALSVDCNNNLVYTYNPFTSDFFGELLPLATYNFTTDTTTFDTYYETPLSCFYYQNLVERDLAERFAWPVIRVSISPNGRHKLWFGATAPGEVEEVPYYVFLASCGTPPLRRIQRGDQAETPRVREVGNNPSSTQDTIRVPVGGNTFY